MRKTHTFKISVLILKSSLITYIILKLMIRAIYEWTEFISQFIHYSLE